MDVTLGLATSRGRKEGSAHGKGADPRSVRFCDYLHQFNPNKENILKIFSPFLMGRAAGPGRSPELTELLLAGSETDTENLRDSSHICISEARPHFSYVLPFPRLFELIKGAQKITYAPQLQQQRLGFSLQSKQHGWLIQMLIARSELAPKRETLFPANDQKVTPSLQESAGFSQLDIL